MAIDRRWGDLKDAPTPSPELVEMWRNNLRKSQQRIPAPPVLPATMMFQWTGGGAPIVLASTDPVLLEVPYPARIVWAHLYAGDGAGNPVAVSATVDVQLTSVVTFGASYPLHSAGTRPTLTADSATDCDITGWGINLTTTDALVGRLLTFSGAATWLALTLLLRPTDVPIGVTAVTDNAGDPMTDNNGDPMVFRS